MSADYLVETEKIRENTITILKKNITDKSLFNNSENLCNVFNQVTTELTSSLLSESLPAMRLKYCIN